MHVSLTQGLCCCHRRRRLRSFLLIIKELRPSGSSNSMCERESLLMMRGYLQEGMQIT